MTDTWEPVLLSVIMSYCRRGPTVPIFTADPGTRFSGSLSNVCRFVHTFLMFQRAESCFVDFGRRRIRNHSEGRPTRDNMDSIHFDGFESLKIKQHSCFGTLR